MHLPIFLAQKILETVQTLFKSLISFMHTHLSAVSLMKMTLLQCFLQVFFTVRVFVLWLAPIVITQTKTLTLENNSLAFESSSETVHNQNITGNERKVNKNTF